MKSLDSRFRGNDENACFQTSNEVISSAEVNEPGMRLFFGPFLIVHLAQDTDMDDYLGFMSPNPTRFYEFTLNPK
ncbi:MAG: hypothetical protein WAL98_20775 [Desulfatiglandaceae bacterium]